ncbi:MAG: deoxyribodipyrimidine photo-lyase, partial [Pseudomonadota bacterium]
MTSAPTIVWFRQDLRLADNPALSEASALGKPIIPLYVLDDETEGTWRLGGASRWWLHYSLRSLGLSLKRLGSELVLRHGNAANVVTTVAAESGADTVLWNRCYEPKARERDAGLKNALREKGIVARSYNAALLFEPWEVA